MKIELLYIPGCPHRDPAAQMLGDVLRDLDQPEKVIDTKVSNLAQATAVSFPGSPTIRINGQDVEPEMPESRDHGLSCRTYVVHGKRQGFPQREWIYQAILSAAEDDAGAESRL
jgi:hypothetical protein